MKNKSLLLTVIALIALLGSAATTAFARDSFALGLNFAPQPIYAAPAPVAYVPQTVVTQPVYPPWYNTPTQVVYVNGKPHYMHYWAERWYDEETLPQSTTQVVNVPVAQPVYYSQPYPYYGPAYGPSFYGRMGYGWGHHGRW